MAVTHTYWNGSPARTHLFEALSVLLPVVEDYIVRVVETAADRLEPGSPLEQASRAFVAEERAHARAHRNYNQRLEAQGYDIAGFENAIAADLRMIERRFSLKSQLALIAAGEHMTAVLARASLRPGGLLAASDARQSRMWRWHCEEEIAHQHVSLDLLPAFRVGYALRLAWYLPITLLLAFDLGRHVLAFARVDMRRGRLRPGTYLRSLGGLLVRDGRSLGVMAWGWAQYLAPLRLQRRAR